MKIVFKGTNLELSDALKEYVEEKIGSLDKFIVKKDQQEELLARVELAKTTAHHQSGDIYRAEVNLNLSPNMLRSVVERADMYQAIDEVKDELKIALIERNKTKTQQYRRGARVLDSLKRLSPLAWAGKEYKKMKKLK